MVNRLKIGEFAVLLNEPESSLMDHVFYQSILLEFNQAAVRILCPKLGLTVNPARSRCLMDSLCPAFGLMFNRFCTQT